VRYAFKKSRMIRIEDIATGKNKVTLTDLTQGQFTGSQETVYAEGTDGAKLAAFDINKVAGYNATSGSIETKYLAMQVGSEEVIVSNGNEIKIREVHKATAEGTITLDHKASGEAGSEIRFIYATGKDGMPDKDYAQAAAASATEFAYDAETKVITLPTNAFKAGDEVVVDYFPTFKQYTRIDNEANKFAMTGRVIVDAWFTDICDETDVPLQVVIEKGKISGEIDLTYGDQAAVQNIAIEAITSVCSGSQNLWKLYTYDMQEIVD